MEVVIGAIMMRKMTLSNGKNVEVKCLSCALTSGLIEPDGGVVLKTPATYDSRLRGGGVSPILNRNLMHIRMVAYPIKGVIMLASKRHIKCFDELTEKERIDYIDLLSKIRNAQRKVLEIEHVYYFYNEDTTHHFHTWMVPRYEWMYEFGRSIESVRPVLVHSRNNMNTEENLEEVRPVIKSLTKELNV